MICDEPRSQRWKLGGRILPLTVLMLSGLTIYDSWNITVTQWLASSDVIQFSRTLPVSVDNHTGTQIRRPTNETIQGEISDNLGTAALTNEGAMQQLLPPVPQYNFTFSTFWDFSNGPRPQPWTSTSSWNMSLLAKYYSEPDKEYFSGTRKAPTSAATYSAAWLSSKETFLTNPVYNDENCPQREKNANLEFGHFAAVRFKRQTVQTNDMLDFFVHHLSNYRKILGNRKSLENDIVRLSRTMERGYEIHGAYNNPTGHRNGNVLCILPYWTNPPQQTAVLKGPKTSSDHRQMFLRLTIKTLANVFPNIVISVSQQHDFDYVMNDSGLNQYLYDVHFVRNLTRSVALPFVSSCHTRRLLLDGTYDSQFEFVYYTETDQILQLRNVNAILAGATRENYVMVPWRGLPMPLENDFVEFEPQKKHQKNLIEQAAKLKLHKIDDLRSASCCYSMNSDHLDSPLEELSLMQQHESFAHITGIANIHKWVFRGCEMRIPRQPCTSTAMA